MLERTRHKTMCCFLKYVIRLVGVRNISGKGTRRCCSAWVVGVRFRTVSCLHSSALVCVFVGGDMLAVISEGTGGLHWAWALPSSQSAH